MLRDPAHHHDYYIIENDPCSKGFGRPDDLFCDKNSVPKKYIFQDEV